MIKLRLSFDVSLSKVILGVAGISASICAFQYFISEKNKLQRSFKTDFVQNIKDLKKDNEKSNIVSATPLVELGIGKDKSDKNDFKTAYMKMISICLRIKVKVILQQL